MSGAEAFLERVRRAAADSEDLRDTITPGELEAVERQLGFPLHPFLAALYTTVGNGGFGPMDGLLRLCAPELTDQDGRTGLGTTLRFRAEAGSGRRWPADVLPILAWGCGMMACVDCRSADGTVLLYEPNANEGADTSAAWFVDSPSLADWLRTWLDRCGWYEDDQADLPVWSEVADRLR
ncbi:SMI1/KNR4 family protein [Kitasatospora sp. CB01950]|uniref:SMI1/KNR4 family protein n=1 Tax=Kitasatospora sp. CB01950 TaxID=1703930 RepID=UPI00116106E0|nr:SMI1/KNR4 family protein [Kitasatospora sp. CB01950]